MEKSEQPRIIKFEKGLDLQEKKEQQTVDVIRERIVELQKGKEQYEQWQRVALEQGDEQSALLYETKALENELLIMDGEILCNDAQMMQTERWQQHFQHAMESDDNLESAERLENIDAELEFVSDYLESLLEDADDVDESGKQKIQELQKRKELLESERSKYAK